MTAIYPVQYTLGETTLHSYQGATGKETIINRLPDMRPSLIRQIRVSCLVNGEMQCVGAMR